MNCVFCGGEANTEHHLLPTNIKKTMGWHGERASKFLQNRKIPLCVECHVKLTLLQEPLIKIIKYLTQKPYSPTEFAFILDDIYNTLNEINPIEKTIITQKPKPQKPVPKIKCPKCKTIKYIRVVNEQILPNSVKQIDYRCEQCNLDFNFYVNPQQ